jgi:hypothetical protein
MIYRRETHIYPIKRKNKQEIISKKGGKKSYFMLYILYTDKTFAKESKSHGFHTTNKRQRTKLPELVIFYFGELGFYFS